jgi:hypothetical protein
MPVPMLKNDLYLVIVVHNISESYAQIHEHEKYSWMPLFEDETLVEIHEKLLPSIPHPYLFYCIIFRYVVKDIHQYK